MTTRELKLTIKKIERGGYGMFDRVWKPTLPNLRYELRMVIRQKRNDKRQDDRLN